MLIDILKYFVRFIPKDNRSKIFSFGRSDISGYDDLMTQVLDLEHIESGIDHCCISASFDDVKAFVDTMSGSYLFVDYGEISCTRGRIGETRESAAMAITVAFRVNAERSDIAERVLRSDQMLSSLRSVASYMKEDSKKHPSLKSISSDYTFVPFESKELSSIGWTMLFNRDTMR